MITCVIVQYDGDVLRCRSLDEVERELPTRAASQTRAEPIRDLSRNRGSVCGFRRGSELGGRFDELSIGDAVAEADVHDSGGSLDRETKCI